MITKNERLTISMTCYKSTCKGSGGLNCDIKFVIEIW